MTPGVIAQVRDIVPLRPLTRSEAMVLAERQAGRLRALLGVEGLALDEHLLTRLPRLEVRRHSPWPSSGASQWIDGRWVIVLNAAEPFVRQRFSLAHELKHIIDHRFVTLMYRAIPEADRHRFIEGTCDFFAGCLLMPKIQLRRAWTEETQRLDRLARMFHVSEAAMATRLAQLGLTEPAPRCAPTDLDLAAYFNRSRGGRYQRAATPGFAPTAA
jgi:Zn-dependent peptidase ImmA (M78 family)